ncbi:MAG: T9SS type A sorting domain-containing protein [Melioribacteraceae bacterium]|nr:T9SS type A sorting domain-containing protein [Melioribacteraceae bacterium]
MRIFLLLIIFSTTIFSQTLLLEENFNYTVGSYLTDNGWVAFSGTNTNKITIENGNLVFSNYPSSNIGQSVLVDNDGEDVYLSLNSSKSSGIVYFSFLMKVINATTAGLGDYFISLGSTNAGTLAGRLFLKKSGSQFAIGISKTTGTTTFTNVVYNFNTTYLIVIKYIINSGPSNDDVNLFIFNESIPNSEPTSPTITQPTESTQDPSNISVVALRQNSTTNVVQIDGIRVSDSWSQAPLPVQLTSFTASLYDNKVKLNWSTATEINNYGFNIERKTENDDWNKIAFVNGNGNSNSPKDYTFVDINPPTGKVFYRLKQIDFDGTYEYSNIVEVDIATPQMFVLEQNYPNPFNPETNISYKIPNECYVTLKVYDIIGNEISTLVNEFQKSGSYNYKFSTGQLKLTSGIYFYKLQAGHFSQTKKFIIMK